MMGDRRATLIVFLVLCSLSVSLTNIAADNAAEDSWTTMEPMPTARSGLGVAVVNCKIYAIGGSAYDGKLNTNEMYNPATGAWTTKTPMPTPRHRFAIAVVDNKIYVVPTNEGGWSDVLQIYGCETDTWSYGEDIPTLTNLPVAAATTGAYAPKRIYVMGGYEIPITGLNQIYDPETDTWSLGTQMPTPRYSMGVAVVNEQYTPIGYIPEFPSWTSLLIMLVAIVAVAVIYRRRLSKGQGEAFR